MYESFFESISENKDIRKNLISLRTELKKDMKNAESASYLSKTQKEVLKDLLDHPDAKTRKNAALILGESKDDNYKNTLFRHYQAESTLFIRSGYLEALSHLDHDSYKEDFKKRIYEIENSSLEKSEEKHAIEELHILKKLVFGNEKNRRHIFTGYKLPSNLALITYPGFEGQLFESLKEDESLRARAVSGAVLIRSENLSDIIRIRTVREILFHIVRNPLPSGSPDEIASYLIDSGLISFLKKRHDGEDPFFFRIDMRTKLVLEEKSRFIKKLAYSLEKKSNGSLINSASDYEVEIRIIQSRDGKYSAWFKLFTYEDDRFSYRKEHMPSSMHPVRAAQVLDLCRPYLRQDAIVLDPMCGNGTFLIERQMIIRARSLYGVDIYGKAIDAGRTNAKEADVRVYFINRDFRDFRHEYKFDELITEMPAVSDGLDEKCLYELHRDLIKRLPVWMENDRYVFICTVKPDWLRVLASKSGYMEYIDSWLINKVNGQKLMIYRYHSLAS